MYRLLFSLCTTVGVALGALGGAVPVQGSAEERAVVQPQKVALKGDVKTVDFDSKHLGKVRKIRIYLPPGHDPKKSYPVLFGADGFDGIDPALIEPLILAGKLPSMIIVSPVKSPGMMRQQEYLPHVSPKHFEAHEMFYIQEMVPWAEREFGASRDRKLRSTFGSSNSGPFALMMASKYPEKFGNCIAMMVYGMRIKLLEEQLKEQPKDPTRYVLVTGSKDDTGVKQNTQIAKLLKDKNFPVNSDIIEGGAHTSRFVQEQLPPCLEAIFGQKK